DHVRENVTAATGPLPDASMRDRMAAYVRDL
ncbi:MAG: aldo/keto reductase, partial [Mesorhizobium sp.]